LKLYADLSLIEKIRRQQGYLFVTFSKLGSQKLKPQQILKNLALTKFKATISEDEGKLTLRLVIQPKMTEPIWLEQLTTLVAACADELSEDRDHAAQTAE
jgi:transcription-repair coupling factor (superfamily II helicase)